MREALLLQIYTHKWVSHTDSHFLLSHVIFPYKFERWQSSPGLEKWVDSLVCGRVTGPKHMTRELVTNVSYSPTSFLPPGSTPAHNDDIPAPWVRQIPIAGHRKWERGSASTVRLTWVRNYVLINQLQLQSVSRHGYFLLLHAPYLRFPLAFSFFPLTEFHHIFYKRPKYLIHKGALDNVSQTSVRSDHAKPWLRSWPFIVDWMENHSPVTCTQYTHLTVTCLLWPGTTFPKLDIILSTAYQSYRPFPHQIHALHRNGIIPCTPSCRPSFSSYITDYPSLH